ncbi:hypothetical protein [Zavarzinella formosa]|uniref:hypothetical protein n=1 Tax=Zavarzinella formosa TaxID=360055 RepID=UPI00037F7B14|nr:hypothetical protein [Zavarzinella formosa]
MTDSQKTSIVAKDPRYAPVFAGTVSSKPLTLCADLGRSVGVNLRLCPHGHGDHGVVKPCRDCGSKCADYTPVDEQ